MLDKHNAAIVGFILLGAIIVIFFGLNLKENKKLIDGNDKFKDIVRPQVYESSPQEGNKKAKLVFFEFGDFSCPACAASHPIVTQLYAKYADKILHVWKDLPLHGEQSQTAAVAARCAQDQGKFWQYHDWLFANQDKLDESAYAEGAKFLSLDAAQFKLCLDSGDKDALIKQDDEEAFALGIKTTPTYVIGDVGIVGVASFDELEAAILEQLGN